MANTIAVLTEVTQTLDGDEFHLKRGTGVDSDKRIKKENLQASLNIGGNPDQIYGGVLLSGSVTWLSGLIFDVSACSYLIDGVAYASAADQVTLAAADATNDRIDVIYVDTGGLVGAISGTPAANPAKAEIDPATQLELTFIVVPATSAVPGNTGVSLLYGENAGDPTEWDATVPVGGARIDVADVADPYAGTVDIALAAAVNGDYVQLASGSAATLLSVGDMDALEMHVKVTTWGSKRLRVAFFDGVTRISNWVEVRDGNFAFSSSYTAAYQTVSIPNAAFGFTGPIADSVQFMVAQGGGSITAYIDQIRVQTGGGTTIINVQQGLTEEQLINTVRTFNAQQLPASGVLTDAATVAWDLDVYQVAKVTLGGNRTLAFSNARAGATYILWVYQDGIGSRALNMTAADWNAATPPTLSAAAGAYDVFTFTVAPDGTTIVGAVGGQAFG